MNNTQLKVSSFFPRHRFHTYIINKRTVTFDNNMPPILIKEAHSWNTVQYAAWKVMLSHSSETLAVAECFWISLLPNRSTGGGGTRCRLSGFMRRRAALKCKAATVYWEQHSVHNLSCYQMSWEEDSEWGLLIHLVIVPPIFMSLHTSLMITMMTSLFWLASFCLITFNEQ